MVSDPGARSLHPNANHNPISSMVYAPNRCNLDLSLLPGQPFVQADSSEQADKTTALQQQRLALEVARQEISDALMHPNSSYLLNNSSQAT